MPAYPRFRPEREGIVILNAAAKSDVGWAYPKGVVARIKRTFAAVRLRSLLRPLCVTALVAAGLAAVSAAYAFPADQCAADRFGDDLNCTANDVSITGMRVVGDTMSCVGGTNVTLDLQMTVNFATPDRYDIGIFVSKDGKDPQTRTTNGGATSCSVSVLPTASPFLNLDGGATGDTCGDGNGTVSGGTGSGIHYMSNVTVPCQSLAGAGGNLYIPFVVSWDNQASPSGDLCTSNLNPVPNTKSKCNAPTVVQGTVGVVVLPKITKTDGTPTLASGAATDYIVTITNDTGAALDDVAVFKDPAVSGIVVGGTTIACSSSGGASCPAAASRTVAAMQGAGITIPALPNGGAVTFTVPATVTGNPSDTRTNTASVTVGAESNYASDTNIIVGTIAVLPSTQAKAGDKGAAVSYTYDVYNYGSTADNISLSLASNKNWSVTRSPTSVLVAAGSFATVTVTVNIPGNAALGTVDTTTLTATSGVNPAKKATATAVTTVTDTLSLTPHNSGSGGAGSYVYYAHRVQNNANSSKSVSLTPSFPASCIGWSGALYEADKTTALATPVTLAANGGYKDFILRISIPLIAAENSVCIATLTAAIGGNSVSVTDTTTVKKLVLYEDAGYTTEQDTYPAGNRVYAKAYGLIPIIRYYFEFLDPTGAVVCRDPIPSGTYTLNVGTTWTSSCLLPDAGPLGTWTARIFVQGSVTAFASMPFYVGPDHLKANFSGTNPAIGSNAVVTLALHDKTGHVVPFNSGGVLVKGSPTDTEGPLMITVTLSGSAEIFSTTLENSTISGQTVTGKLSSTTGTATLTITNAVAETVTVTPASYKGKLYGSTVRDEPTTVTFAGTSVNHYEVVLPISNVACLPSTVTIRACSDTSSPCGNFATTIGGQAATLSVSAGATLGEVSIPFSSAGVASTTLSYPAATDGATATVTLTPPTAGSVMCCPGDTNCTAATGNACSATFNTAGLIFSASANGLAATPATLISGQTSATYYLRAIKTDTTTKACETAVSGEARDVPFSYGCVDPASCTTGTWMTVDGTTIPAGGSASPKLTFDAATGAAPFTFKYNDAGKITLSAGPITANNGAPLAATTSDAFVVRPAGLCVYSTELTPCAAADATCPAAKKAGETFNLTVSAARAISDANSNPDCSDPNATKTPNYRATGIALGSELVAPAGGAAATLGATSIDITANGWNSVNQTVSEVGVFSFTASPPAYHGVLLGGPYSLANIGRFTPDHFVLIPAAPVHGCGAFTYFGQDFETPFAIVAQRAACTETCTDLTSSACICTTKNYSGSSWAKLGLNTWTDAASATGLRFSATGLPTSPASVLERGAAEPAGTWAGGVATFPAATRPKHKASRPGTAAAAPADVIVLAQPKDSDGVALASATAVGTAAAPLRYGMLKIDNAAGSERQNLPVPVTAMYYAGSPAGWAVNTLDGCTATLAPTAYGSNTATAACYGACTGVAAGDVGSVLLRRPAGNAGAALAVAAAPTPAVAATTLASGRSWVTLHAPVIGSPAQPTPGALDFILVAPAWLKANAGQGGTNGNYDWNPMGRITFGVGPTGNKTKFIYIRENY